MPRRWEGLASERPDERRVREDTRKHHDQPRAHWRHPAAGAGVDRPASPGTEVSVYVDPDDAATAYLEWKRWSVGSIILFVWGGVFVFAGLLVLAIFMLVGG